MKILHTADWHLGKYLEGHSRLDEQKKFIKEINEIADENEVDLILICGDIYDTFNPPAEAEKLFYRSLKKLANRGERIICIISGNHDSPHRLMASYPLAYEQGIIILGNPLQNNGLIIDEESPGKHKLVDGGRGYLELSINGENAVILTLPYPSESRLNQVLTASGDERELQQNYSGKVGQIFKELQEHYRKDTINLAVSHLFVAGGRTSQSERSIQIGGGYRVFKEDLPEKSQYTALGHLHKNQPASRSQNAYYSGSPLQYSLSERDISKSVTLIDLGPDSGKPEIADIKLKNRKPIELWEVEGIEKAVIGNRLFDISHAVQKYVESNGFSVVRDYVGHGIGRDMHEDPQVPNFGPPGKGPKLKEGMTLAIEPMVNVGSYEVETLDDDWTVVTKDRSLSAHFEHTIVITENGFEILSLQ